LSSEKYKKSEKYLFSCIYKKDNIVDRACRSPQPGGKKHEDNKESPADFNHIKQIKQTLQETVLLSKPKETIGIIGEIHIVGFIPPATKLRFGGARKIRIYPADSTAPAYPVPGNGISINPI